ncbi:hypothetical protein G9A89_002876 [Geosiphon pyriformis]|nr:hypothetical protein G9A89_002876 [Geosiphon pyriformis]
MASSTKAHVSEQYTFFVCQSTKFLCHYRWKIKLGKNPAQTHKAMLIKRLKPIMEKRLQKEKEQGKNYELPVNVDYSFIAEQLLLSILSAIDSLSINALNVLYAFMEILVFFLKDLAARKDYLDGLLEEQNKITKESDFDGELTLKLDSFIKESMRHRGDIRKHSRYVCEPILPCFKKLITNSFPKKSVAFPHMNVGPQMTFSNGYQIPHSIRTFKYNRHFPFSQKFLFFNNPIFLLNSKVEQFFSIYHQLMPIKIFKGQMG